MALSKNMKSPVGRASVPAIAEVAARDGRPTNCNILATDHWHFFEEGDVDG